MFLPSGFKPEHGHALLTKPIRTGLYAVEGAYKGSYDFFAPSPLAESTRNTDSVTVKLEGPTGKLPGHLGTMVAPKSPW